MGGGREALPGDHAVANPSLAGLITLDHVGIAVEDIEAAMKNFGGLLGIQRWHHVRFRTRARYRGRPQTIGGYVATGSLGSLNIELVQPIEGSWTAADALSKRGEGLYHVGYRTNVEVGPLIERCAKEQVGVALTGLGDDDALLFAYLDAEDLHGVTVEIVGPSPLPNDFILSYQELVVSGGHLLQA